MRWIALAAVAALATAAGSPAAVPGIPAIYINYNGNCTFSMTVDPGIPITATAAPGQTFPPGTYQLLLFMPNPSSGYTGCARPVFTFSGAGVSTSYTFPGQELSEERVMTLQPSSTYTAEDANAPDATRRVFSTAATGSSSTLAASAPKSTSTGASVQGDIVGSGLAPYRGKLTATVDRTGRASLKQGGRAVGSLKAGRYDVAVDDEDALAGFFVQRRSREAVTVTTPAFVGRHTRRITLSAGAWAFFTKAGKPTPFVVIR